MLSRAEIGSFQKQLLALKKRLGADLSELEEEALQPVGGEESGGLSNVPLHPADLGTDTFEEEFALELLEKEEKLLDEVNDALARIEEGKFARCENCGQEISRARLKALPYARYCIRCARKLQGQRANSAGQ
jgi:RNA polymerase-binding protein DksA